MTRHRARASRRPRRLTTLGALAISAAIATFAAIWSVAAISLAPPKLQPRQLQIGAAATNVMLDGSASLLRTQDGIYTDFPVLVKGGALYGNLMASPPVRDLIARRAGLASGQLAVVPRLTDGVQRIMREPDSEQRANQILVSKQVYRLDVQPDPDVPVLHLYAQAPSGPAAERLANAAVDGLKDYLRMHASGARATLLQLGRARGRTINHKAPYEIAVLTWLVAFALSLAALTGIPRVRQGWIAAGRPVGASSSGRIAKRAIAAGGDWPHTTRVLPWMIAAFIAVIWLVPFNVIQLSVSLPFDLKLDRLLLPILCATWIVAVVRGGPDAPQPRLTLIHVGVGIFVGVTCLGVVVNAHALNQSLELDEPLKKLTLLLSYALFFVIVASTVRRTEVGAFSRYTLWLAAICAIGTVWEYRFLYDVFYDVPGKLLPGIFQVGTIDPSQVDDIGRRMTTGPAEHPLETVGMLTMAFPIALVGIIHGSGRRQRFYSCLAALVLLAAAISTYRKSALLAPFAVILTIACFRRRELLRLAPLGVLSLGAIHVLSPGALGSILFQFHPDRLGASTVSDRTSDYDAIRPDLWTHLLFGRGYGSYDHLSYRVLDSEILSRLVDDGVLGLLCLLLMLAFVVAAARPLIGRRAQAAPFALAVAAAAIAFLVLAFLFDATSFPHTPYILMSLAGLLAVEVQLTQADPEQRSRHQRRPGPVTLVCRPADHEPLTLREPSLHP